MDLQDTRTCERMLLTRLLCLCACCRLPGHAPMCEAARHRNRLHGVLWRRSVALDLPAPLLQWSFTPLLKAIHLGKMDVAKLLVDRGANVNLQSYVLVRGWPHGPRVAGCLCCWHESPQGSIGHAPLCTSVFCAAAKYATAWCRHVPA